MQAYQFFAKVIENLFDPTTIIVLLIYLFVAPLVISFSRRMGTKLADWFWKKVDGYRFGKRIYSRISESTRKLVEVGKDISITKFSVTRERGKETEAWTEIDINKFDRNRDLENAILALNARSSLFRIKRFLNENYRESLNLAMLRKSLEDKEIEIDSYIKDLAAEKEIVREYETMKDIVEDEDKFQFLKEEGIRRASRRSDKDNIEASREQFTEMIREIWEADREIEVIRVDWSTTKESVINRIEARRNTEQLYLLARGGYIKKLNDLHDSIKENFDTKEYRPEDRSHHSWNFNGETYKSVMLKIEFK